MLNTQSEIDAAIDRGLTADEVKELGVFNFRKRRSLDDSEWPAPLDTAALYGLPGEVVRAIAPHTEADDVAILIQLLAAYGCCIGKGPHYQVEGSQHAANLFAVLVGQTSKGRKGTSWSRVRQLSERVDEHFTQERIVSGLSSGEGLIWAVRDPIEKLERTKDESPRTVVADPGVEDKRLLVVEEEFASVLKVAAREGNTLSPLIRQAWDRGDLQTLTKNSPAKATGAHIAIVGHIVFDELRRYLTQTESANGFANRFLFVCIRRSKCLPDGGNLIDRDLDPLARGIAASVKHARSTNAVTMTPRAREMWHAVYPALSEGAPGMFGAVTSRGEAQVIRLALIYALMDCRTQIDEQHLTAALAVWEYAEASARHIFGATLGDTIADEILAALRLNPDDALTRTGISDLFRRHKTAAEIDRALKLLEKHDLVRVTLEKTSGRSVEMWGAK